jgi:hypothetical protein
VKRRKKYEILRRWEVDELRFGKIVKVPTRKEKIKMGLSDKEWIMMCFRAHQEANQKCFREYSGHKLCGFCPKSEILKTKPPALDKRQRLPLF